MDNCIYDSRIGSNNYMLQMSIGEYYEIVKDCLTDNEYQRKRVKNSGSIYNLLKQDLVKGCVMPPIVLALCDDIVEDSDIKTLLYKNGSKLKILDGLQRSYTIKEIVNEYHNSSNAVSGNPLNNIIRVEVYVGINKLGILYRMLTLNTGQTQMSTRHQIEIIYSDYRERCDLPGVVLYTEVDSRTPSKLGEYKFRDIIEGFTSYIEKDYLTLDRMDILDNVRNLERLANVDPSDNLFDDFVKTYHSFVKKLNNVMPDEYGSEQLEYNNDLNAAPFATSFVKMFNKSQSMTGYGNAIATLRELDVIKDFNHVSEYIENLKANSMEDGFNSLIVNLDKVKRLAKKIGNDQRLYFYQFFKNLFDKNEEAFLDINAAAEKAFKEYQRVAL